MHFLGTAEALGTQLGLVRIHWHFCFREKHLFFQHFVKLSSYHGIHRTVSFLLIASFVSCCSLKLVPPLTELLQHLFSCLVTLSLALSVITEPVPRSQISSFPYWERSQRTGFAANPSIICFFSASLVWFMYSVVPFLLLLSSSAWIAQLGQWMFLFVSLCLHSMEHDLLPGWEGTEWIKHTGFGGRGQWATAPYSSVFNFLAPSLLPL